jgi:ribosomal protein L40E
MTPVFSILIFFVVIVFTAVVFFGWIAFSVIRFVFGGVGSLFAPTQSRGRINASRVTNTVQCSLRMCGAINPAEAKFCRRCGRGLPAAQRVQVRRAAVW